jgi:hypothetical protein
MPRLCPISPLPHSPIPIELDELTYLRKKFAPNQEILAIFLGALECAISYPVSTHELTQRRLFSWHLRLMPDRVALLGKSQS